MKRILKILIIIFIIFFTAFSDTQGKNFLKHPSKLFFKPLRFSPPKPIRHELKNGMIVYLLEDHELPIVNISAKIKTGSIYDPEDKAGLSELTGIVMRTGGTVSMSGEEVDERLEYIAASISVAINTQSGNATLRVLKKDLEEAIKIYAEILRYPIFEQDKFDLAKKQKEEELRRENDDPQDIAFREFKKILYRDNPRGLFPTISTIQNIQREDLIKFHNKYFHPDRIILGISGDFVTEDILNKLVRLFGDWEKAKEPLPKVPIPQFQKGSLNLVSKDLPQSIILLGHLAVPKNNPDFYAFTLLNYILGGGGFNSRITSEIRSNRGLAYSVGSFYRGDIDYGIFGAYCFTKPSATREVIDLIKNCIKEVRDKGITQKELQWAKDSIINNFIFSFSSSHQIVLEQMEIEYYNLPPDYVKTYQEKINRVTREDLAKVAKAYLHPDNSILLIVGNENAFEEAIKDLGKMNKIELP